MSKLRFHVVEDAFKKKAVNVQLPKERPSEYYASLVFNRAKMFKYLPEKTYQQLEQEGWLYRIKGKGTFIKVNAQRKIELNTSTTLPAVSSNEVCIT